MVRSIDFDAAVQPTATGSSCQALSDLALLQSPRLALRLWTAIMAATVGDHLARQLLKIRSSTDMERVVHESDG